MLGLSFSSKLDCSSYITSTAKTAPKKIEALIQSIKFCSSEVAPYLYESTMWLSNEFCCHAWACVPTCYLDVLGKLQKQVCRTVDSWLAASLEPLAQCQNVASLGLFYRYYFGLNWPNWFHFLIFMAARSLLW